MARCPWGGCRVHHQWNVHPRPRELKGLQRAHDKRSAGHLGPAGRRNLSSGQRRDMAAREPLPERMAWSKINERRLGSLSLTNELSFVNRSLDFIGVRRAGDLVSELADGRTLPENEVDRIRRGRFRIDFVDCCLLVDADADEV